MLETVTVPKADPTSYDFSSCICFGIRKASRAITQICDDSLRSRGLRSTQFTILLTLAKQSPITIGRLADELWVDPTALSRNLKPLLRKELVKVQPGSDQRTRLVSLTETGEQEVAECFKLWEKNQENIAKIIPTDDIKNLQHALENLFKALHEHNA
ncbi:MAG: MarR family winged helix-turn-helix transcriptional regulator [Verrucomicrobiota bacterium]